MSKLLSQPCSGVPPPKECSKEIHGTVAKWRPGSVFLDMVCRCCGSGSPSSRSEKLSKLGMFRGPGLGVHVSPQVEKKDGSLFPGMFWGCVSPKSNFQFYLKLSTQN